VLLGSGTRLFENLGDDHIQLAITRVWEGFEATIAIPILRCRLEEVDSRSLIRIGTHI